MSEKLNRAEIMNRSDQRRMVIMSLVNVAILGLVAYRFKLLDAFRPNNAGVFWLGIVWFALSAMETFNKRMGQMLVRGEAPPYAEYPGLHFPMTIMQYGLLAYLLYLDWLWALTLYVLTLALAVSPILESIGKVLMFMWLKKRIDGGGASAARSIIAAYGKTLEMESARPGLYAPVSSLPVAPRIVATAIISEYRAVASSNTKQPYLAQLQKAYLALAQFIPDELASAANEEWGSLEIPETSHMDEAISAHVENETWLQDLWQAEIDQPT